MIAIRVDVKVLGSWPKVVHQLLQGSRRDAPVVKSLVFVELCMHGHADFKRKSVRCGQSIPEDDSSNKAALDAFSIFNGDVAAVYDTLLVRVASRFYSRSAAEERGQALKRRLDSPLPDRAKNLTRMYMEQKNFSWNCPVP